MAIVTLTVVEVDDTEAIELHSAGYTAAEDTNGFKFINDGKTLLFIDNADDGACTITVDVPQPCSYGGTSVHDISDSLANGDDFVIGPFPSHQYNDSDGYVTVSITPNSDATDISAKAVRLT